MTFVFDAAKFFGSDDEGGLDSLLRGRFVTPAGDEGESEQPVVIFLVQLSESGFIAPTDRNREFASFGIVRCVWGFGRFHSSERYGFPHEHLDGRVGGDHPFIKCAICRLVSNWL